MTGTVLTEIATENIQGTVFELPEQISLAGLEIKGLRNFLRVTRMFQRRPLQSLKVLALADIAVVGSTGPMSANMHSKEIALPEPIQLARIRMLRISTMTCIIVWTPMMILVLSPIRVLTNPFRLLTRHLILPALVLRRKPLDQPWRGVLTWKIRLRTQQTYSRTRNQILKSLLQSIVLQK
jgi:hypothetical protein